MVIKSFILVLVLFLFTACSRLAPGLLYTNITRPYSTDFNETPVGQKHIVLGEYSLREPVSGYGISVEWTKDQIRSEAQKAGISRISHVEEESLSILLGIYSRRRLIIYGD